MHTFLKHGQFDRMSFMHLHSKSHTESDRIEGKLLAEDQAYCLSYESEKNW